MKSFFEDSYVHLEVMKILKIKAEAKHQMKIDNKSQLPFYGEFVGSIRKESYKSRERLLGLKLWFILYFSRKM